MKVIDHFLHAIYLRGIVGGGIAHRFAADVSSERHRTVVGIDRNLFIGDTRVPIDLVLHIRRDLCI